MLESGSRFQISLDGRVLTISDVGLEDVGVYTCHASSIAGTASDTVTLDVQCKFMCMSHACHVTHHGLDYRSCSQCWGHAHQSAAACRCDCQLHVHGHR